MASLKIEIEKLSLADESDPACVDFRFKLHSILSIPVVDQDDFMALLGLAMDLVQDGVKADAMWALEVAYAAAAKGINSVNQLDP